MAAAAYRAGVSLVDARQGMTWDYTRRQTVEHARILAPEGSPSWVRDRAMLWNAVEASEKRKDSQLAREIQLALPEGLPLGDQVRLLEGWVDRECVALGMVADVAIHADHGNPHGHVLLTMRGLEGEAFGKKATDWNRVELLEHWRESWAGAVNEALAQRGFRERVDHRSLEARGIDREPMNLSRQAYEMERRGVPSRQGEAMRERQRERDRKRKERAHGTRTRNSAEPEAFDLTWALGLDPSAVALDGGRGRGRAGQAVADLGELGGPKPAADAPGAGALGGSDAPGAGADPGAGVVGRGVGAGADGPAPGAGDAGEAPGAPVVAAPAPAGAAGGPGVAAAGQQPRGPVREALVLERVYERAEAVKAFARELATLPQHYGHGDDMPPAVVATLAAADPLQLPPLEGHEKLYDADGNPVYGFIPVTPNLLPTEVQEVAYAASEPEDQPPGYCEEIVRTAYGLEERPEAHYDRPWAERREDLVQDGLRLAAARTAEVQALAEHQAQSHVSRLWDRLVATMERVGEDLAGRWRAGREALQNRLRGPQEPREPSRAPQPPSKAPKPPRGPSRDESGGMSR